jgi:hypothetical protein
MSSGRGAGGEALQQLKDGNSWDVLICSRSLSTITFSTPIWALAAVQRWKNA